VPVGDQSVPVGLEAFYEATKGAVYRRINRLAKTARRQETLAYAEGHSLDGLVMEAKLSAQQDALVTSEEQRATKLWIRDVVVQASADEHTARVALAEYILSGQRPVDWF
jgi:hypothetical protein